jgi:transcriptional antiterminator RfaH
MQAWYLLYCKRGQLQRAQEHLERQSANCLTPVITLEKCSAGSAQPSASRCSRTTCSWSSIPEVIHHHHQRHARRQPFVRFGAHPRRFLIGHSSAVVYQQPEGI